jgi:hypothetical protein
MDAAAKGSTYILHNQTSERVYILVVWKTISNLHSHYVILVPLHFWRCSDQILDQVVLSRISIFLVLLEWRASWWCSWALHDSSATPCTSQIRPLGKFL